MKEMYVANFSNGNVIKITPDGTTSLFVTIPGSNNGHLAYSPLDSAFYVNSHGSSRVYKVTLDGEYEVIAGSGIRGNVDGAAEIATFSRPNGIAVSTTADTLFLNSSIPTVDNPQTNFWLLNPSVVRMITGLKENPNSNFEPWKFEGLELRNFPNPAKDYTTINYELPMDLEVSIWLLDISGKVLKRLAQGFQKEGKYTLDLITNNLAPRIYEYALVGKEFILSRRLVVQR